jgi:hypothetical protein
MFSPKIWEKILAILIKNTFATFAEKGNRNLAFQENRHFFLPIRQKK